MKYRPALSKFLRLVFVLLFAVGTLPVPVLAHEFVADTSAIGWLSKDGCCTQAETGMPKSCTGDCGVTAHCAPIAFLPVRCLGTDALMAAEPDSPVADGYRHHLPIPPTPPPRAAI